MPVWWKKLHQTGILCNFAPSTLIKAGPEKPNSKESKEMKKNNCMRNIKITISGGEPQENRNVCERCCGCFSKGQVAQPTDIIEEQNGACYFYVNVNGRLTDRAIADKIYTICNEGQMVSINGVYYEE